MPSKRLFDRHVGDAFLAGVPAAPGVYRVHDEAGELVYVGKAKNLKRRLAQYRDAGRRKRHAKMRDIVRAARHIEFEACPSHLEACLLEAKLIREHRPRFNVAGAYHFLYPFLGLRQNSGDLALCYTTRPDDSPDYSPHGAYRSRQATRDAFRALVKLLRYLAPAERPSSEPVPRYSFVRSFRKPAGTWLAPLTRFLRGDDTDALRELVLALLAKPAARRHAKEVEASLFALRTFRADEIAPLARARARTGYAAWPVPQAERDPLFLRAKYADDERAA